MLVKKWMNKDVITVEVDDSIQHAASLMKQHNVRGLPVMKKGKLVGVVTDRDLKRASASDATSLEIHELLYLIATIKVKDIMTKNPITIPPDYTMDESAKILLDNKISGLPIVDYDGRLVGIITQTDIFRALISLTGLEKRGIQFGLKLENRPGAIKEVADTIRKYGGYMASVLSTNEEVLKGCRKVYIRMYGIDRRKLPELKKELSQQAELLYKVDMLNSSREVYE